MTEAMRYSGRKMKHTFASLKMRECEAKTFKDGID